MISVLDKAIRAAEHKAKIDTSNADEYTCYRYALDHQYFQTDINGNIIKVTGNGLVEHDRLIEVKAEKRRERLRINWSITAVIISAINTVILMITVGVMVWSSITPTILKLPLEITGNINTMPLVLPMVSPHIDQPSTDDPCFNTDYHNDNKENQCNE